MLKIKTLGPKCWVSDKPILGNCHYSRCYHPKMRGGLGHCRCFLSLWEGHHQLKKRATSKFLETFVSMYVLTIQVAKKNYVASLKLGHPVIPPQKKVIQNDQITAKISWFISEFWGPISWTQKSGRNAQNGRRQTPCAPGSCAESLRRPRTGPWSRKWISAAWNMHEVWIVLNIYYSNRFVNDWRIVLYTMNSLWIIGE